MRKSMVNWITAAIVLTLLSEGYAQDGKFGENYLKASVTMMEKVTSDSDQNGEREPNYHTLYEHGQQKECLAKNLTYASFKYLRTSEEPEAAVNQMINSMGCECNDIFHTSPKNLSNQLQSWRQELSKLFIKTSTEIVTNTQQKDIKKEATQVQIKSPDIDSQLRKLTKLTICDTQCHTEVNSLLENLAKDPRAFTTVNGTNILNTDRRSQKKFENIALILSIENSLKGSSN